MAEVVGVVVAHADVGEALVRAVEGISGVRGALRPVSNQRCTPSELERRVEEAVGEGPGVVFVDMASGSCAFASRRVAARTDRIAVVTGVSLPMLLDFVFHREMSPGELAERVVGKGRAAAEAVQPPEQGPAPEQGSSPEKGERDAAGADPD